jgi:NAD(P)-dependent dehydrogenase (short-subunit alcohol dehydrogenase family)
MLDTLENKVALITGAGSGIGRGLAEALGKRGMRLVVTDVLEDTLERTTARLSAAGVVHVAATLDVRDPTQWSLVLAQAEEVFGPVQLLCNVAGVTAVPGPLLDLPNDAWNWVIETNLQGTYHGSIAFAKRLRALGLPGHLLNTSSVQGLYATPGFGPYNTSKFAVIGLSETLRIELKPHNIGVSILCPGPTRGNIMANSSRIAPELVKAPPIRVRSGNMRFMSPAEVAEIVIGGIARNDLYIHTHAEYGVVVASRCHALLASFDGMADPTDVANVREVEAAAIGCYEGVLPRST